MRPLIGISADFVAHFPSPERDRSYTKLYHHYYHAIIRAGGLPVVIPVFNDSAQLVELVAQLAGVVLSGGDDYPLNTSGIPPHPKTTPMHAWRSAHDFALARHLLSQGDVPVLGICAGMQLLALASGGTLFEHIPDDVPHSLEHGQGAWHEISVVRNSRVGKSLGSTITVNSFHHQAVRDPGAFRAVAQASDGVIEAIESFEHERFMLGVQWHPELMPDDAGMLRLFADFVAVAASCATSRCGRGGNGAAT